APFNIALERRVAVRAVDGNLDHLLGQPIEEVPRSLARSSLQPDALQDAPTGGGSEIVTFHRQFHWVGPWGRAAKGAIILTFWQTTASMEDRKALGVGKSADSEFDDPP